jgi:hypothetical protein
VCTANTATVEMWYYHYYHYKTDQTINGNEYKTFNLTSWAEDSFSIINKWTVYHNLQESNMLCFMIIGAAGACIYQTENKANGKGIQVLDV